MKPVIKDGMKGRNDVKGRLVHFVIACWRNVMPITSMKVSSTNISDINYDPQSETMSITFNNGSAYNYLSVPEGVYMRLMSAPSKGEYFAQYIRGRFATTKVN